MKVSKKTLWTVGTLGTVAMGGVGWAWKTLHRIRERVADEIFLQHELETLEGEGGICLS